MNKTKTKSKTKTTAKAQAKGLDTAYILKITIYLLLGSLWINFTGTLDKPGIPIPLGALICLFLASKERYQIDRKIEYAIILVALFVGYFLPGHLSIII